MPELLRINNHTFIPLSELNFSAARSSGPGGQHVNKTSTKVLLEFDVFNSPNLTDEQKQIIQEKLENRITKDGGLQISSQQYRSQSANKQDAIGKFVEMLEEALRPRKKRRRKRISQAARHARLQAKRHRSEIKKMRKNVDY